MKKLTIDQAIRIIALILLALALYGVHEQREADTKAMFTDQEMVEAGA